MVDAQGKIVDDWEAKHLLPEMLQQCSMILGLHGVFPPAGELQPFCEAATKDGFALANPKPNDEMPTQYNMKSSIVALIENAAMRNGDVTIDAFPVKETYLTLGRIVIDYKHAERLPLSLGGSVGSVIGSSLKEAETEGKHGVIFNVYAADGSIKRIAHDGSGLDAAGDTRDTRPRVPPPAATGEPAMEDANAAIKPVAAVAPVGSRFFWQAIAMVAIIVACVALAFAGVPSVWQAAVAAIASCASLRLAVLAGARSKAAIGAVIVACVTVAAALTVSLGSWPVAGAVYSIDAAGLTVLLNTHQSGNAVAA
jgi:hypothetical protein